MTTPKEIRELSENWKGGSWRDYEPWELGMWVHLFLKRATHRRFDGPDEEAHKQYRAKVKKDLRDARNYAAMLREAVNEVAKGYDIDLE